MSDYLKEIADTPEGWVETFEIMAKYLPGGMNTKFIFEAEHDVIYSHISGDDIPEASVDGKRLTALGWHFDEDVNVWATFT